MATFRSAIPLVSSVVYQGETEESRRAAHALLAEVDQDADRRVWHRAAASVAPDESVASELDDAAGRALARGAPGSAVRAFASAARFSAADEARGTAAGAAQHGRPTELATSRARLATRLRPGSSRRIRSHSPTCSSSSPISARAKGISRARIVRSPLMRSDWSRSTGGVLRRSSFSRRSSASIASKRR